MLARIMGESLSLTAPDYSRTLRKALSVRSNAACICDTAIEELQFRVVLHYIFVFCMRLLCISSTCKRECMIMHIRIEQNQDKISKYFRLRYARFKLNRVFIKPHFCLSSCNHTFKLTFSSCSRLK